MEEFIMEQIISACITGGAAIIGVVLIEWLLGKRTFELLSKHNDDSHNFSKDLSKEHNELSKEHGRLIGDHIKLYQNQKHFSEKQNDMYNKVVNINTLICEEKTAQSLRYENLNDKQKDIKQYVVKIEDMARDWENQATIIKNLQNENRQLRERISELEKQNIRQKTDKDRTDYFER